VGRIPALLAAPQVANMVIGGKTPIIDQQDLAARRYAVVLYANASLQGAVHGMQTALGLLKRDGRRVEDTVTQLYTFDRLGRVETDEVTAGDICAVVGLEGVDIGDTVADPENAVALPPIKVDEPTLDMIFRINDSPFAGQDGEYVTSRQLRDRLMKELESNVALRVRPDEENRDEFHVAGRGLLHLSILLENMRRQGFELSVGKPRVITREVGGKTHEPIEYLVIEVPPASVGAVMELVGNRRAECVKMDGRGEMTHMEFTIPARGLIGLGTRLMTATSGEAIVHHNFYDYQPVRGSIPSRLNGVMVSTDTITPLTRPGMPPRTGW